MSFDQLNKAFSASKVEIKIQLEDGAELTFYAGKIGALRADHISKYVGSDEKNWLALLVSEAITDSNGAHMSYEQALDLPKDIFTQFFEAIVANNSYLQPKQEGEEAEKK